MEKERGYEYDPIELDMEADDDPDTRRILREVKAKVEEYVPYPRTKESRSNILLSNLHLKVDYIWRVSTLSPNLKLFLAFVPDILQRKALRVIHTYRRLGIYEPLDFARYA